MDVWCTLLHQRHLHDDRRRIEAMSSHREDTSYAAHNSLESMRRECASSSLSLLLNQTNNVTNNSTIVNMVNPIGDKENTEKKDAT